MSAGAGRTGRGRRWVLLGLVGGRREPDPPREEIVPPGGYEGQSPHTVDTPPEPGA